MIRKQFKSELKDKTINLLKKYPHELKQISSETNLSESWLCLFRDGRILYPDVAKVEVLYNHLNKSKLKV